MDPFCDNWLKNSNKILNSLSNLNNKVNIISNFQKKVPFNAALHLRIKSINGIEKKFCTSFVQLH